MANIAVDQFRDWNNDGRLDLVRGYSVRLNSGSGNPFRWSKTEVVLPRGEYIAHPSGIGDDWFWPHLDDFDLDGKIDVLFGDWSGHVWFHRNLSTKDHRHFDVKGFRLKLNNGQLIKVGPITQPRVLMADINADGDEDLFLPSTQGSCLVERSFLKFGYAKAQLLSVERAK